MATKLALKRRETQTTLSAIIAKTDALKKLRAQPLTSLQQLTALEVALTQLTHSCFRKTFQPPGQPTNVNIPSPHKAESPRCTAGTPAKLGFRRMGLSGARLFSGFAAGLPGIKTPFSKKTFSAKKNHPTAQY